MPSGTLCTLGLAIFFILCSTDSFATVWTPESFQKFSKSSGTINCGNLSTECVCNPDGVLTSKEVSELRDLIDQMKLETNGSVPCGSRHYVTSVIAVEGIDVDDKNRSYFKYAKEHESDGVTVAIMEKFRIKVFSNYLRKVSWQLGSPDCGEDIYVVLTTAPFEIFVSAGQFAAKKLTKNCLAELVDEVCTQDHRKTSKVVDLLHRISAVLQTEGPQCGQNLVVPLVLGIGLGFFVLSVSALIISRKCKSKSSVRETGRPKENSSKRKRRKHDKNSTNSSLPEEEQPWLGETSANVTV